MTAILIVDDMPFFREPIEAVLRAEGYETATASNGHEALAAMGAARPALVLLDLGMPVMDGIACLRNIRADRNLKSTPVIVLSAESDRTRVMEALRLGVSGYLLKSGFSLKAMLEKVRATVALPAAAPPPAKPTAAGSAPVAHPVRAEPDAPGRVACGTAMSAPPPAQRERDNETTVDIKSLGPILTRAELLERLKGCEELKGLSPTVSQVLKLTASRSSSLDAVSKAVRQDQAMALKILKVANSSVYSRGERVDTVHKAILRIGMESIRQAVLNIGVVERFSSPAFREMLSTPQFWEHSIACGIIAAEIAHATDAREADSAFTSGLLHDLGRVIFAEALGDTYIRVIEMSRRLHAPLELVETRMLLLNHAEVMDRLLSAWKFPKHLVEPIMHHHLSAGNVRSVAPTQASETLRLGLANRLAHAMLLGNSGNETIYPTEDHCRALGICHATIRAIEESSQQQTDDTKCALLTNAHSQAWPRRAEQLRALIKEPFRPLYVSVEPELDAYRMFCAALAGPPVGDPPNVAVIHIASTKERGPLEERLAGAERDAGVQRLPVLMLSSAREIALDESALRGRKRAVVSIPLTAMRFVSALNALTTTERAGVAA